MQSFLKSAVLILVTLSVSQLLLGQEPNQQRPRRVGPVEQKSTPTPAKPDEVDEGDVVRVDTQLVSVPAVVTTPSGRPLAGLRTENFALFENGQLQRITDFTTTEAPFEIAILLDTSGSTRSDIALIRQAALSFIDALRPGDRVALVGFNMGQGRNLGSRVEVLTALTDDRKSLNTALNNLGTSNGTPFYDALERIADQIFREPPREEIRGRRAIVALTDGVDSSSDAEFQNVKTKVLSAGIAAYFIQVNTEEFVEDRLLRNCQDDGALTLSPKQLRRYRRLFQPRARPEDLTDFCDMGSFEKMTVSRELYKIARGEMNDLAKVSGGTNFLAASLQEARAAFARVAAEIGTQYSLGYYPSNKARDGKFRTIRVEVQGLKDKPVVRAREGYFAPKG